MWTYLVTLVAAAALVNGHGRVVDPPGRGSMWRAGFNARANYDDDGLNCGGFYHQHTINGGKCGVCGDPYDAASPRSHERGGIYDSGLIAATYEAGSIMTATVEITAHHRGYWEFKICPDPNNSQQDCFDEHIVELETGGTKYYPKPGSLAYKVNYRLPEDIICDNCVLQWKYTCGNNWGDCKNGTQGLGCGDQETFWACSDIAITGPRNIPVDSLLIPNVNDLGAISLLLSGYVNPYFWLPKRSNTAIPTRKNKRKHKSKKKGKPYKSYKSKWSNYWR